MTAFSYTVTKSGILLRLEKPVGLLGRSVASVPWAQWLGEAPAISRLALSRLADWALDERVEIGTDLIEIPHSVAATLSDVQARSLGLPGAPPFAVHLEHDGTFDQPAFRFSLTWRKNFQPVIANRMGCILQVGRQSYRLGEALYQLSEAADAFNAAPPDQMEARFLVWAKIQPYLAQAGEVQTSQYLQQTRIAYATRFSIHLDPGPDGPLVAPVLFGPESTSLPADESVDNGAESVDPLLPQHYQEIFAKKRFVESVEARTRYAIGDGWYAVLDDSLKAALNEVRRVQISSPSVRRQFARNPQAWLKEKLGDALDDTALDSLFLVTDQYSDRVVEMGIWQKPLIPWVQLTGNNWLPKDLPENIPVNLFGRNLTLNPQDAVRLLAELRKAQESGTPSVEFRGEPLPANSESISIIERACAAGAETKLSNKGRPDASESREAAGEEFLPASNLNERAYEAAKAPRSVRVTPGLPEPVQTMLKPHQEAGLAWLQSAYVAGFPGVLLADDMGLGKTLQALCFLVWLTKAQRQSRPLLVVAPTGLLKNWENEAALHFRSGALGAPYLAYGRDTVTADKLRAATWVLTTYETVRNREEAFAGITFGAAVFDEMQKIKSPDSHITKCALTLNAEFVLGMTGTPVENRLADLWCLMDRIWGGLLPELKEFSAYYESGYHPERNEELKRKMLLGRDPDPAIMLRRMKHDHLPGLPERRTVSLRTQMPAVQVQAYDRVIADTRGRTDKGWMLQALQHLRGVCLHPIHPDQSGDYSDDEYIGLSARLTSTFKILDEVFRQKRKALVFVEMLAMQDKLAGMIQRRYRLPDLPMIISGEVTGPERQKRVDRFQATNNKFEVIILSPKAGGVGITLTAANHVIHLSRWWNPAVEDQCSDRVYRIGQSRDVEVHFPLSIHPTLGDYSFDVTLDSLLERKRKMSRELLAPPAITDDDLQELWKSSSDGAPPPPPA